TAPSTLWTDPLSLHDALPILMFVTPAYAQGAGGTPDVFISILPFVLIFVIMYFLIIRPQRAQMKKRSEMLAAIRRGDTVVTGGRSEEHTSELQSRENLVCRLL